MKTSSAPCSVYERVMANSKSRHAYFNTTRGVLTGDPEQEETQELRAVLNENSVAHLFTADRTLPQPIFYLDGSVRIGSKEISALAEGLAQ